MFFFPCLSYRPPASRPYAQEAMDVSGPAYSQQFGAPPTSVQQLTNQMTGMQVGPTVPPSAGPGYGKYFTFF